MEVGSAVWNKVIDHRKKCSNRSFSSFDAVVFSAPLSHLVKLPVYILMEQGWKKTPHMLKQKIQNSTAVVLDSVWDVCRKIIFNRR